MCLKLRISNHISLLIFASSNFRSNLISYHMNLLVWKIPCALTLKGTKNLLPNLKRASSKGGFNLLPLPLLRNSTFALQLHRNITFNGNTVALQLHRDITFNRNITLIGNTVAPRLHRNITFNGNTVALSCPGKTERQQDRTTYPSVLPRLIAPWLAAKINNIMLGYCLLV